MKEKGWSGKFLETQVKDRTQWRSMFEALGYNGDDEH